MNRNDLTEDQNSSVSKRLGALLRFVAVGCGTSMVRRSGVLASGWSCGDPDLAYCARCQPIVHEILLIQQAAERAEIRAAVIGEPIAIRSRYRLTVTDENGEDMPTETIEVRDIKIRFKNLDTGKFHVYNEGFFGRHAEKIDE